MMTCALFFQVFVQRFLIKKSVKKITAVIARTIISNVISSPPLYTVPDRFETPKPPKSFSSVFKKIKTSSSVLFILTKRNSFVNVVLRNIFKNLLQNVKNA